MKVAKRHAKGLLLSMGGAMFLAGCSDGRLAECGEAFPFTGPAGDEFLLLAEAINGKVQLPEPSGPSFAKSRADVPAYRFVVDRVENAEENRFRPPPAFGSFPLSPSDTFMVVPWLHDKRCSPIRWDRDDWIPEGTAVVFRVSEGRFYRGMFVFDVLADYSPYPVGLRIANVEGNGAYRDRENWLTAVEFFDMMLQLPIMDPTLTRAEQLRRIDGRFRTGPTKWVDKFPGLEIIRRARAWAAGEEDDTSTQ